MKSKKVKELIRETAKFFEIKRSKIMEETGKIMLSYQGYVVEVLHSISQPECRLYQENNLTQPKATYKGETFLEVYEWIKLYAQYNPVGKETPKTKYAETSDRLALLETAKGKNKLKIKIEFTNPSDLITYLEESFVLQDAHPIGVKGKIHVEVR